MEMSVENKRRILCCGVCVLDIVHVVPTYPKEDADIRSHLGGWQRGGNAANNCTTLANLGASCEYLGTFTTAEMFKFVIKDMEDRGINIENCVYHNGCAVPISTVLLSEATNSRTIIHTNPNLPYLVYSDFEKIDLDNYKWIHFEARNLVETREMIFRVDRFNEKRAVKIPISLDLEKSKWNNIELAPLVNYIFMGRDCAEALNCSDMKSAVYTLRERIKIRNTIICPWGPSGVGVLTSEDEYFSCPAFPPETIVDTLGAGDTYCAAALYALSAGNELKLSIEFASRVAGAKVGGYGYDHIRETCNELKSMLRYQN